MKEMFLRETYWISGSVERRVRRGAANFFVNAQISSSFLICSMNFSTFLTPPSTTAGLLWTNQGIILSMISSVSF